MPARKFMKGIVYGALVGGALTLLDRDVRKQLITDSKKIGKQIVETVKHPQQTIHNVQKNVHQLRETYNELNDDLQYVMSKAAELKELGEEAVKTISKTKNKLINDGREKVENTY